MTQSVDKAQKSSQSLAVAAVVPAALPDLLPPVQDTLDMSSCEPEDLGFEAEKPKRKLEAWQMDGKRIAL